MTSKVVPISGREPGAVPLLCVQCGRYWGMDDLLPVTEEVIAETIETPVGLCPVCAGEGGPVGRVYKMSGIQKEVEQEEPEAA